MKFSIVLFCCCLFTYTLTEYDHTYYWRDYRSKIAEDAVEGDEGIFIGQVHTATGILPATFYPNQSEAYATCYGHRLIIKNAIKLLCDEHSKRLYWKYVNIDKIKEEEIEDLVIGGMEANTTLYIGKIFLEGEWRIGKVFPYDHKYKGLTVWREDGTDCNFFDFQILKFDGNYTDLDIKESWLQ